MALNIGRSAVALAIVAFCALSAGCNLPHRLHKAVAAPGAGMADRCADLMATAFPSADIRITKRDAAGSGIDTIVAHVEGVRRDVPKDLPLTHDLAVECQFTDNVLTGFKWTKGPLH